MIYSREYEDTCFRREKNADSGDVARGARWRRRRTHVVRRGAGGDTNYICVLLLLLLS